MRLRCVASVVGSRYQLLAVVISPAALHFLASVVCDCEILTSVATFMTSHHLLFIYTSLSICRRPIENVCSCI
jgi:hypothetical protein